MCIYSTTIQYARLEQNSILYYFLNFEFFVGFRLGVVGEVFFR